MHNLSSESQLMGLVKEHPCLWSTMLLLGRGVYTSETRVISLTVFRARKYESTYLEEFFWYSVNNLYVLSMRWLSTGTRDVSSSMIERASCCIKHGYTHQTLRTIVPFKDPYAPGSIPLPKTSCSVHPPALRTSPIGPAQLNSVTCNFQTRWVCQPGSERLCCKLRLYWRLIPGNPEPCIHVAIASACIMSAVMRRGLRVVDPCSETWGA